MAILLSGPRKNIWKITLQPNEEYDSDAFYLTSEECGDLFVLLQEHFCKYDGSPLPCNCWRDE